VRGSGDMRDAVDDRKYNDPEFAQHLSSISVGTWLWLIVSGAAPACLQKPNGKRRQGNGWRTYPWGEEIDGSYAN